MSYAEYLALERTAQQKHEYVNGRVYATAEGTPEHARLAGATIAALTAALGGKSPSRPISASVSLPQVDRRTPT